MAARAIFTVECEATEPGQAVFVIGSDKALGAWKAEGALKLTTNGDIWPKWTSEVVRLVASREVEYKFIIKSEKADGKEAVWESIGNRTMDAPADASMAVRAVWNQPRTDVAGVPPASLDKLTATEYRAPEPAAPAPVARVPLAAKGPAATGPTASQGSLASLGREAPTGLPAATPEGAAALEVQIQARDLMRRNFSQSLTELGPDPAAAFTGDAPPAEMQRQASPGDERRGVSLKHVSSFSVFTVMDSAEEKTKKRIKKAREAEYQAFNTDVPIVVVTSEISPYSKSGGLGLVAGSYSQEFPRIGHRTMVVAPKYQHYAGINLIGEKTVFVNGRDEHVRFWHKWQEVVDGRGCDFIFVDHPAIERAGGLYNDADGKEYVDNLFRFTLLSAAAMEAPLCLHIGGYPPWGDKVLFLANDWQAGLVPLYLHYRYRCNGVYCQSRCIYVIHNLGYQGQYWGLDACGFFAVPEKAAVDLVWGNCVNLCKGAILCCDRVLTVSPNYAREIQTKEGGFSLEDFLVGKANGLRLTGILNGIDECWDPETDTQISKNYDIDTFVEGKRANKVELQRSLGLLQDPAIVLMGFVGRLTWQKGVDVLAECISWLMQDQGNGVNGRVQLIIMGNGENQYSNTLTWAENTYRGRVCGYVGFDPKIEHQMMAGCDLLIMPSRYEPCGLPQMICQQYGCLPIVTATGGLVDSVRDISEGLQRATGFHTHPHADALKGTMYKAMELFLKQSHDFQTMQRNGMETDFYWPKAIDEYERTIDFTLYDPPNFH